MPEDKAREQMNQMFGPEAPSDYSEGDPIKFLDNNNRVVEGSFLYSLGSMNVGSRETVPTYAIEADGGVRYIPKTRIVS